MLDKLLTVFLWVVCTVVALPMAGLLCWIFLFDASFHVKGTSMEPTLHQGERVMVNKLVMGARLYRNLGADTSSVLSSFRMPGLRKVRAGDVLVANYPYAKGGDTISFRMNYVYLKRCYGAPGDTVRVVNGRYVPSLGDEQAQQELGAMSDEALLDRQVLWTDCLSDRRLGWTIRNFGPYVVPSKGMTIPLDTLSAVAYRRVILHETGDAPEICGGRVFLSGRAVESYTFQGNWYFLGGDNVLNSRDSRYLGPFPEAYIVGVATRIVGGQRESGYRRRFFHRIR